MGFFSKVCAKTNLPVITMYRDDATKFPQLNNVVALLPDGRIFSGQYDGYGRVGDSDNALHDHWDQVKIVLQSHYNGERYQDLKKSGNELGQGYFMASEFLDHCIQIGSFKTYAAYKSAFQKLAGW